MLGDKLAKKGKYLPTTKMSKIGTMTIQFHPLEQPFFWLRGSISQRPKFPPHHPRLGISLCVRALKYPKSLSSPAEASDYSLCAHIVTLVHCSLCNVRYHDYLISLWVRALKSTKSSLLLVSSEQSAQKRCIFSPFQQVTCVSPWL